MFSIINNVLDLFYNLIGFDFVGQSEFSEVIFRELIPVILIVLIFYLLVKFTFKLFGIKS